MSEYVPTTEQVARAIYDALSGQYGDFRTPYDVLESALDVDELARVLHDAECTCDRTTHTPQWWENRERSARAVVAHLTKGNENDE